MPPSSSLKTTSAKPRSKVGLLIAIIAGVLVALILIVGIWLVITINTAKNPADTKETLVTISPNSSLEQIGKSLQEQGLITNATVFSVYAKFGPSHGKLTPGIYLISPSMSLAVIADTMGNGKTATRKVTFQEGLTITEMANKWAKAGLGSANDFIAASKLTYNQPFLKNKPSTTGLEGYLFPATYDILVTSSAQDQINTMLNAFQDQVLPQLSPDIANTPKLNDVVTLASIVEKEANTTADRKLVAGVFYNRLKAGMKLESDVTVNYATGKSNTSPSDLSINSPYNTYKVAGIPVGPICNPGLDAILAVANPTQSDYLFFIADKQGNVHFAKTLSEHEENIKKYLQ